MADTLRELILANIKTALQAVTIANGFNVELKSVERDRLSPLELEVFPAALIMDLGETPERQGNQVDRVEFSVLIELWIMQESGGQTTMNQLIGDVRKKLNEDVTRGSNAVDTQWNGSEAVFSLTEEPLRGEQLTYLISYRSKLGDPFSSI